MKLSNKFTGFAIGLAILGFGATSAFAGEQANPMADKAITLKKDENITSVGVFKTCDENRHIVTTTLTDTIFAKDLSKVSAAQLEEIKKSFLSIYGQAGSKTLDMNETQKDFESLFGAAPFLYGTSPLKQRGLPKEMLEIVRITQAGLSFRKAAKDILGENWTLDGDKKSDRYSRAVSPDASPLCRGKNSMERTKDLVERLQR